MQLVHIRLVVFCLSIIGITGASVLAGEASPSGPAGGAGIPPDFFAGDYVVVGQLPDGRAAYSGNARIAADGDGLSMQLRIDGETTSAAGRFDIPSPPGEGMVLRFVEASGAWKSTCLWHVDLDNYPRLTCTKLLAGADHTAPGLESFFPTGAWPDSAPGKAFNAPD
ncbi:hypothetical protein EOI86_06595 [Hwanghaeella grinnelliae]|uniref:Uncharacterized protein n=1 Tax=Hwanghaeella grinnelliae TaxID=2500179 RepID=A0A3S2WUQ1_9PROT|nr:hypothetical protein [Hwanghaeella grinnelliae]RVU38928.1 hypothetical protein EOI86_06595 [Hwanghaeella grinnelliae]